MSQSLSRYTLIWRDAVRRAACCVAAGGLLAACGGAPEATPEAAAKVKHYERGPIALDLAASADTLTTADTLVLTLTATVEDGYSVAFPDYPEPEKANAEAEPEATTSGVPAEPKPEPKPEFTPAGYEDTSPTLQPDGRVTRSRIYRLEPFLEGEYTVQPLAVSFWKEVEGEDQKNALETEEFPVTVASVIPPGEAPGPKDIAGPVTLRDPVPWLRYGIFAFLAALALGAAYWYWFVRVPPGPPPAPPVPPHQRALEALEAIKRSKLVEQGLYKEYYIRVSDVLRRYMEEQFQLRAPERTTEEFLEEIQHNAVLGLQEQLLLREFLRHCDLVKFARAEPTSEQIRDTFSTCEQFIIDSEAAYRASRLPSEIAEARGA